MGCLGTLYAIVLILPDEIEKELDNLRGDFRKYMAYISIPHITLVYPFKLNVDINQLVEKLQQVAERTKSFNLELEGFNYFQLDSNVAYVEVVNKQPLVKLAFDINQSIEGLLIDEYGGNFNYGDFIPHITIGTEIPDDIFPLFKKRLMESKMHHKSVITSFSLLSRYEDQDWELMTLFKLLAK